TSNICTAQVLLGVMASMYAVYHGPEGLKQIAQRTRLLTQKLAEGLKSAGAKINAEPVFDTLTVSGIDAAKVQAAAAAANLNLRRGNASTVGISRDKTATTAQVEALLGLFGSQLSTLSAQLSDYSAPHARTSAYLTAKVFNSYHTEHEMLRYIKR